MPAWTKKNTSIWTIGTIFNNSVSACIIVIVIFLVTILYTFYDLKNQNNRKDKEIAELKTIVLKLDNALTSASIELKYSRQSLNVKTVRLKLAQLHIKTYDPTYEIDNE